MNVDNLSLYDWRDRVDIVARLWNAHRLDTVAIAKRLGMTEFDAERAVNRVLDDQAVAGRPDPG